MTSIDQRFRHIGDEIDLDVEGFHERVGELNATNGEIAARGLAALGVPPLTLVVDEEPITLAVEGASMSASRSAGDALTVSMDGATFSDLVQDVVSTFGAQMTQRATVTHGDVDDFVRWEPVLRAFLDGRPVHEEGSIDFRAAGGESLDLRRSFTVDDDPGEVGHFLAEAGFLHFEGVFTQDEMAAVSADLDRAGDDVERGDGESWWARNDDGWAPSRILGFNLRSPALRELLHSPGFARIGTFTDDEMVQRDPDVGDSAEGLVKRIGIVEGISDVSWHKDCSMGGHSRSCSGLVVGISVTGAGPTNGELGVVAGSHRANIPALGVWAPDLPKLALPTATGDVTVHCTCTLHMSRPPVSAERRVVYTGFGLAPREDDHIPATDLEQIRRDRAALNDHVRRGQSDQEASSRRRADFDL